MTSVFGHPNCDHTLVLHSIAMKCEQPRERATSAGPKPDAISPPLPPKKKREKETFEQMFGYHDS